MKRAGDSEIVRKLTKEAKLPSRKQQQLLDAAVMVRQDQPDDRDLAFVARQLVQCTMPHRDPGKVEVWQRRNGALTLVIRPGWDIRKNKDTGYPYGSIPRLLMYWITTEAKRTSSPRLTLGRSLAKFMGEVGLNSRNGTGIGSDRQRLHSQMERLFQARISFHQTLGYPGGNGTRWLNMDVTAAGELWWNPNRPMQDSLWESWIELGDKFFEAITQSTVPIDTRALKALKQSPLQLDLYGWAAYMADRVNRKREPCTVSWIGLVSQLGCDYDLKRMDNVKRKIKAAFTKVATVFPHGIKHCWSADGIEFFPGTILPVPPREPSQLV